MTLYELMGRTYEKQVQTVRDGKLQGPRCVWLDGVVYVSQEVMDRLQAAKAADQAAREQGLDLGLENAMTRLFRELEVEKP